ncbi:MmcQ/YjbR family DNA-binding protein [Aliikangiella sp. IMCC44359]|uniref:MmcQ/YjbR family DNA-binding protein n=1 Tax=Aliikangiella sp. IMCC44359 TaxID=3459125 RepID=UPI00403B0569
MDYKKAKKYLLKKPETREDFPFGPEVSVFKVKDKMFATLALGKMGKGDGNGHLDWWMNLKCDPDEAVALRDIFKSVIPGYHMNKRLWNTIILDGSIPPGEIERMIDNSFMLVVNKMTKKDQASILKQL